MDHRTAIRQYLLREQRRLVRHVHDALEVAGRDVAELELGDDSIESQLWTTHVVTLLGSELHDLHDVIAALHRLDSGTYGICRACGDTIDPVILDRVPTATDCDECAITRDMVTVPARMG